MGEERLRARRVIDAAFLDHFRTTVDRAADRLAAIAGVDASRRPSPGKWSAKEIIGHLIDSASNNHGRFVRAQLCDDLVFEGYDQDAWVRVQRYQERPWPDLVGLWQTYNHHIANLMESADAEALERPRARHNLHRLGWQPIAESEPATLAWFMRDYVGHLEHHLRQIFP